MARHPEILDHLRSQGLTVIETNGWRTRGSETFDPKGSVCHHTAGAATGDHPSLNVVIYGRSDLPGPLCNVYQSRQKDSNGLDVVWLIAAGRANHAGTGGWRGLTGNSKVWGLEIEHVGTTAEPFPAERRDTAVRVHTAFAKCSQFESDLVCQHWEWTARKQDFVRSELDPNGFRLGISNRLHPPIPTPSRKDDMILIPSFVQPDPMFGGRLPFYELRPVDNDTFVVVSHNGAKLARVDGTTPSGLWFLQQDSTTGAALGIEEWNGRAVVCCNGSGTYTIS